MKYMVEEDLNKLYEIIKKELYGETRGSYLLDDQVALIVKERFSLRNSNQMSITIMLYRKEDKTEMVIVSSGSSQGWLFKVDWGAGKSYINEVLMVLNDKKISYTET